MAEETNKESLQNNNSSPYITINPETGEIKLTPFAIAKVKEGDIAAVFLARRTIYQFSLEIHHT
ncbi:hypothetical protein BM86_34660 [Bacillus thuringiensis]|uniref:Uncharacterized protein n=1 Tax=Bacillus thuringiensis TaxID=1428 RepID=A0A9W3SI45_BACTU|nr:hypothetical protein [Bacillus thuringiensis]ANS51831.1 hypothetical protein BT246_65390 [Bacillus thuringiensis]MBH0340436.1 hypothetical protein [Bacillus thuringiensis]